MREEAKALHFITASVVGFTAALGSGLDVQYDLVTKAVVLGAVIIGAVLGLPHLRNIIPHMNNPEKNPLYWYFSGLQYGLFLGAMVVLYAQYRTSSFIILLFIGIALIAEVSIWAYTDRKQRKLGR